jgi:hypothetical protein
MTIDPPEDLEEKVESYRETLDKEIKKQFPCVTISASFKGYRNLANIDKRNNFICIDVDRFSKSKKVKSNPCIDMLLAKELFINHPCTYYCGYSASGGHLGLYVILRINNPNLFDEYFNYFQEMLSKVGINIDNACKDVTRLRFFSVDKEAYYNPDALYYKMLSEDKKPETKKLNISVSDVDKVENIVNQIKQQHMDITSNYADWIRLAAALYSLFGDGGMSYFQTISSFHPEYSYKKTEDKFNSCKKMTNTKINAFFGVATDYGLRY